MKTIVEKFLNDTHDDDDVPEYKILEDQSVDIMKSFYPMGNIAILPFQINEVHGNANLDCNQLQSLKNGPRVVHGYFNCSGNKLKSLQFCPKFVEGNLDCNSNPIEPWEHRYLLFSEIQGRIKTGNSELNLFFRKYKNQKHLIPQALKELREIQIRCEQKNA